MTTKSRRLFASWVGVSLTTILFTHIGGAVTSAQESIRTHQFTGGVEWAALSQDGKRYAFSVLNQAHLYDVGGELLNAGFECEYAMAFSPDGKQFASGIMSKDEQGNHYIGIQVWNIREKNLVHELRGHEAAITSLVFAPGGQLLASGEQGGTFRLWNVSRQELLLESSEHADSVCLAFADGGKHLISAGTDGSVNLWNSTNGKRIHSVETTTGRYLAIQYSPERKRVYAASIDGKLDIFEYPTLRGVRSVALQGLDGVMVLPLKVMAVSPNCRFVAAGVKGAVILWDTETGKTIARLYHKEGFVVEALCFDGKGDVLISGATEWKFGDKSEVAVWKIKPE